MRFECPRCGSGKFGTGNPGGDMDNATGYCHGDFCDYTWPRKDDAELGVFVYDGECWPFEDKEASDETIR